MTEVIFIECGDGDPKHRYENARLEMCLHTEFGDDLLCTPSLQVRSLDGNFVFGSVCHHGFLHDTSRSVGALDPFIWRDPGVKALSGREYEVLRGDEAIRYAEELHAARKGLHIIDASSPEHRYRILGQMRHREGCDPQIRNLMGPRFGGIECAILDGKSSDAQAERRFIFVDGALVTETPATFDLDATLADPNALRSEGLQLWDYRLIRDGDPGITRAERELALSIAGAVDGFTGTLDIAMSGSAPILSAAHQAHAGDYNLYGADIRALAVASATHARRLIAEHEAIYTAEGPEI